MVKTHDMQKGKKKDLTFRSGEPKITSKQAFKRNRTLRKSFFDSLMGLAEHVNHSYAH